LTWFAGVDWGSERHQACFLDEGNIVAEREFAHSGAGLAELGDWLLSIAGAASTVAVAIEVPHGPVVDSLVDRGFVLQASPVPRMIAGTPMFWLMLCVAIGVCPVASMWLIRGSSNCASGRVLPRN
jgi:Transposase